MKQIQKYNLLNPTEEKIKILNKMSLYDKALNKGVVQEMERLLNLLDLFEIKHLKIESIDGCTVGISIGVDGDFMC